MAKRFRVANNKAAIWEGSYDTAPFDNPLGNLGRVKFHSDLNYIQVIEERTFNVTLPNRTNYKDTDHKYTLYAHGRGGIPFVLGKLTVGGQPVAFCGSVPVQINNAGLNPKFFPQGFARWVSLGADATYVYLYEYAVNYWSNASSNGTYPAITIPVTVWMTNELL